MNGGRDAVSTICKNSIFTAFFLIHQIRVESDCPFTERYQADVIFDPESRKATSSRRRRQSSGDDTQSSSNDNDVDDKHTTQNPPPSSPVTMMLSATLLKRTAVTAAKDTRTLSMVCFREKCEATDGSRNVVVLFVSKRSDGSFLRITSSHPLGFAPFIFFLVQVAASFMSRTASVNAAKSTPMFQTINQVRSFHNGVFATGIQMDTKFARSMSSAPAISDDEVRSLFYLWNDALATLDPDTVVKRYASKSILLPTVSDTPRTDVAGIKDYFTAFTKSKPQGVIKESTVIKGDGWCMDAGVYEFTMGATGDKVMARYTFVYTFEDGEWKIAHHHSSMMPEAFL